MVAVASHASPTAKQCERGFCQETRRTACLASPFTSLRSFLVRPRRISHLAECAAAVQTNYIHLGMPRVAPSGSRDEQETSRSSTNVDLTCTHGETLEHETPREPTEEQPGSGIESVLGGSAAGPKVRQSAAACGTVSDSRAASRASVKTHRCGTL